MGFANKISFDSIKVLMQLSVFNQQFAFEYSDNCSDYKALTFKKQENVWTYRHECGKD